MLMEQKRGFTDFQKYFQTEYNNHQNHMPMK